MIEFPAHKLEKAVYEGVVAGYYKSPMIMKHYQLSDLVQDMCLWWLQNRRDGEQRLAHLLRTCTSENQVICYIKHSCKQSVIGCLRLNEFKHHPSSLNMDLNAGENDSTELIDLIPDDKAESADMTARIDDIYSKLTKVQQQVLDDVIHGYTKTELRGRYRNFDDILISIKDQIYIYYSKSGETLKEGFGINYKLSEGFKKRLKENSQMAWVLFKLTGNIKYFMIHKDSQRELCSIS